MWRIAQCTILQEEKCHDQSKQCGDLKATWEEFECAQFIDTLPEVEYWVHNIEGQPKYSFWLQTSTGWFYLDFVCRLTNR